MWLSANTATPLTPPLGVKVCRWRWRSVAPAASTSSSIACPMRSLSSRPSDSQRSQIRRVPTGRASARPVDRADHASYRRKTQRGSSERDVANLRPQMFRERLHKGYAQSMELTGLVVEQKSRYQRIKIFDTVANGRVMVLDDIVQITTRDESAYAEMLTHLPLLEHGNAERVMIVGGGDLSIADEALKHRSVKEVVLVDIDGRVVELCREHFATINAKAFADKRLTIEIADAFEYLGRTA